ncbi:hypothetical protein I4U23_005477 [Adineta vaga]|nr:hypothetical protein I4U23_005477 [Adineta vaga]
MSEAQPLLSRTNKQFSRDDNNHSDHQLSANGFTDWRRCFSGTESDNKSRKDDTEPDANDTMIGVFHLFRFANRIDRFLMFMAVCGIMVAAVGILVTFFLFGRVMGIFATESFSVDCQHAHQNSTSIIDYITLLSTPATPRSSFRIKVMTIVHWLLIIGIVKVLCFFLAYFIWTIALKRQISRMSIYLFRSLLQRNMSYLDTNPTSQFSTKLFDNIAIIEQGIGFEFLMLIEMAFGIIGDIILCFVVNWQLTLIMISIVPVVITSSFIFSKLIAREAMNVSETHAKATQIVQEVFSSIRTVLSFNGSKFEQKRYERELHPTRWNSIRQGAIYGVFVGCMSLITYLVYSVGFISGSLLMYHGIHNKLSISDMIVIVYIFVQDISCFDFIGPFLQSFSEARGAAVSVFRLIDEAQDASVNERDVWEKTASDEQSTYHVDGDIEFANVNFIYPSRKDTPVLRDLSLIARTGQTTALVGPSGCGKSTCMSLLLRHYDTSSGRITINGRSIADYNLNQLRQSIGVVSQEPVLFGMSIYENIRFGRINATRAEIEEAAQQANAHNFIMQLPDKYETSVGECGVQLSGGEKQRIALARALLKQPTLLLLDEATSSLDTISENIVQEALDRACKGRTTIVIAHRLTTIQNANYVYVLDNGGVIEQGTHNTLMTKEGGKYQDMVKRQQIGRINATKDDTLNMEKVIEEDKEQILERSRLFSDSRAVNTDHKNPTLSSRQSIFTRVLSMNSPEWITILIGCIACLIIGAVQPIFAVLLTKMLSAFNDCVNPIIHRQVWISSLYFLLLGIAVWFLHFLQFTAFSISGAKLTERIRLKAFSCLLRQEIAYFDRSENSCGAICALLSSNASVIQEISGTRLAVICEAFALVCFGLIFGFYLNWHLIIISFIPIFIFAIISYLQIRSASWLKEQSDIIFGRASSFAIEVIHNMRTVKQLSVEKEVLQRYSQFIYQMFSISWKPTLLSALTYSFLCSMDSFIIALLCWWAVNLIEKNELALKDSIMVFAFAIFSTQSLQIVGMLSQRIGASLMAAKNFFDLFDRTPTIDNSSIKGQELDDFRGSIEFDQVEFAYPARPTHIVLNKLHLNIKPGQRIALVGISGCGKSTIIQLLERFYDATHGKLLLDGIDIRELNIQWIRSSFGLVSQEPILFDLTISENIAYGLENVPMEDIINAAAKANIHDFIQQLPQGYETKVGMKGSFLSGGEKQRIAIARVLLRRPKVLLLDEATSAMDSHNEQIIQQALEHAQTEDPSRTSLIIAHRLSTIQSCDLICVLDKGRILETGTHTELIEQRGAYYRMLAQDNL